MQSSIGSSSKASTKSLLVGHEEAAVGVDRLAAGQPALHLAGHVGLAIAVAAIEDDQPALQRFDVAGQRVRVIVDPRYNFASSAFPLKAVDGGHQPVCAHPLVDQIGLCK